MPIPKLTEKGNYDPVALDRYLTYAVKTNIPNEVIVKELKISTHRVIYALNKGRDSFKKEARKTSASRGKFY